MGFEVLASDSLAREKIMPKVSPMAKRHGASARAQGALTGRAKTIPMVTTASARAKNFFIMSIFLIVRGCSGATKSLIERLNSNVK